MNIRAMEARDIAACAEIMAATPLWQRYGVTLESATARLSSGLSAGAAILIAYESDDQPLGFVWIVPRGAFDRSGYIPLIGVHPVQRGKKIGERLLSAAEERLRESALDVFLLCSDFNEAAQRFYERQGYLRVGALPNYILPGVDELIYWKRLR